MQTQTLEILRVGLVVALPVLAVGDTVQVPGSGQQGLVPCRCNICHLILVLLLVSFPNVDKCVWFQLHSTHRYTHQYQQNRNRTKEKVEEDENVRASYCLCLYFCFFF